jgi:hypothetical protein
VLIGLRHSLKFSLSQSFSKGPLPGAWSFAVLGVAMGLFIFFGGGYGLFTFF